MCVARFKGFIIWSVFWEMEAKDRSFLKYVKNSTWYAWQVSVCNAHWKKWNEIKWQPSCHCSKYAMEYIIYHIFD